jgi:hypothetical protein
VYFKLGNIHTHPTGEVLITHTRDILRDESDRPYATTERWKLRGEIIAADASALSTAVNVLNTKYNPAIVAAQPYAGLFYDSGTASHLYWQSAASTSGIKLVDGIHHPQGGGVQHLLSRFYECTLEATFEIYGTSKLIGYAERLEWKGNGGRRIAGIETRNTEPVFQIVSQRTPVMLVQSGHATGRFSYPEGAVPRPLYPDYLQNPEDSWAYDPPKRTQRGILTDYTVRWTYNFILPKRLRVLPHFYPRG